MTPRMSALRFPDTENGSQLDSPDVAGGEVRRTTSAPEPNSHQHLDIVCDVNTTYFDTVERDAGALFPRHKSHLGHDIPHLDSYPRTTAPNSRVTTEFSSKIILARAAAEALRVRYTAGCITGASKSASWSSSWILCALVCTPARLPPHSQNLLRQRLSRPRQGHGSRSPGLWTAETRFRARLALQSPILAAAVAETKGATRARRRGVSARGMPLRSSTRS
ncbi:hypothetical protein MVEN_00936800 [Mycena venus]|uniref:Uncharacterized protein n=1 Tax=Mycena venus TaxID=2733690 RepID=A0A8H6Y852_9AGAR|nr:hypothetical protein MVEN_00936800 [Mycena venus]